MSLVLGTGSVSLGGNVFDSAGRSFDVYFAGAQTTSYTPDYAEGNLHVFAISGTVTLADPTNTGGTTPMVLVVDNTAGGSLVSPNANTLIDTDETGVYEVVILQLAVGVFKYTKGAELFL